nr:hypothetical protein [Chloroflexia bacterium]
MKPGVSSRSSREAAPGTDTLAQPAASGQLASRRGQWKLPLGIVIVALLAIATWWVSATYNGDDGQAAPIATLDTPDFHSLLVDPANSDRILFGSHAGIQES